MSIFASWIFFTLAALVTALRKTRPDAPRPYRVIGYPWTVILFVIVSSVFVVNTLVEAPRSALLDSVCSCWACRSTSGVAVRPHEARGVTCARPPICVSAFGGPGGDHHHIDAVLRKAGTAWQLTFLYDEGELVTWRFDRKQSAEGEAERRLAELLRAGWNVHW